ncbi:MAG TPA: polymer-forming cytoskeletal protein [Polyangiaceae bacterium]|jgi:cytoskeletal protein CcmA (bactofilin family)|nr:MAG: Polymer-forming cytoskeletal [Deltaproteobacteria bacterium ADurb.Bin207]HNS95867.1 polymer-forming cytoskeletal protein [Polyangiaceae bacterium]HNZ21506.1 polymer-forming cytoskeletal protein [Polyangiaceae bacterium]HOD25392.1 polymer-forming cytoskeletal protein [Polyangiaceae bacterium]HOE51376.1 polymer-forming cytoskeletal protein [Polyangiaceae bacterium]
MADSEAIIGQGTFIRGNLRGEGDLCVVGHVEGVIEVRGQVIFEETSIIQADVTAERIIVRGAIAGELSAKESIVLEEGCRVVGGLRAPRLRIEPGALYRGRIDMMEGGAVTAAASAKQQSRPAVQATQPSAAGRSASVVASAPARPAPARPAPSRTAPNRPPARPARAQAVQPLPEPEVQPQPASSVALPRVGRIRSAPAVTESAPVQASDSGDVPPPPVVPALKKKTKGAVRKRGDAS